MKQYILTLFCCGFLAGGCRSTDWEKMRREETTAYHRDLAADTKAILTNYPAGLTLSNCVTIAMDRNLKELSGRLAEKMAALNQKAAFSAFLPQIQMTYSALALSKPPDTLFENTAITFRDQRVQDSSVQILQPIFAPSAWLLYRSAKRNREMTGLIHERTRQIVELSIAHLFYECSAIDDEILRLEKESAAARQLLKEAQANLAVGYATTSEVAQAQAGSLERERQNALARREAELTRSRLLQAMNLWPLAPVNLKLDSLPDSEGRRYTIRTPGIEPRQLAAPDFSREPVEDWMLHALISRPEMKVQDRSIALRRNEVLRSLAMFIPNLVGFANYYQTSDSYTVNKQYWGTGLQASLSSFIGFRDIEAYFKAREDVKAGYLEREDTAMMILLQVLEAHKNLKDARESLEVATAVSTAADQTLADISSQYRAGAIEFSRVLQAQAASSGAAARRHTAAYANSMALYAFRNVLGGNIELCP